MIRSIGVRSIEDSVNRRSVNWMSVNRRSVNRDLVNQRSVNWLSVNRLGPLFLIFLVSVKIITN